MRPYTLPKWCVMKKFQVRNFPDDAYFALEQLANENQRSVEGEARYALLKWIAPPEQVYSGEEFWRRTIPAGSVWPPQYSSAENQPIP